MPTQWKDGKGNLAKRLAETRPRRMWGRQPYILVSGNIPKPMHGVAPRTVLGQKWWNTTRKLAYKSTDYHCQACGVYKFDASNRWLEGHELYEFDYPLGRMTYLRTVPLCHYCHSYIHSGRLKSLLERGEISQAKYVAVLQHGDKVLSAARIGRPRPYEGFCADWGDWRLVIGNKEYPGLFKCLEDWVMYHKKESSDGD